jgi:hypothetical protein
MKRRPFFAFCIIPFAVFWACGDEAIDDSMEDADNAPISPSANSDKKFNCPNSSDTNLGSLWEQNDFRNPRVSEKHLKNIRPADCLDAKSVKVSILNGDKLRVTGNAVSDCLIEVDDGFGYKFYTSAKQGKFRVTGNTKNVSRGDKVKVRATSNGICISWTAGVKALLLKENEVPENTPACPVSPLLFNAQLTEGTGMIMVFAWQGSMPAYKITACDKKGVCAQEGTFDSSGLFYAYIPKTNTGLNEHVYALVNGKDCATTVEILLCKT